MSTMTSQLFGGDNSAPSTTQTSWNRINATYPSSWTTASENVRQTPVGGSFTLSDFHMELISAPGAGTSYTFTVIKNGSATALAVTISDASTVGNDNTNTVSVVAGDTLSIQATFSGVPASVASQSWNFKVTTTDLTAPILSSYSAASTSATNYGSLTGGQAGWTAAEADSQIIVPTSGTISRFYAKLASTPGTSKSYQFTVMLNGSASALDMTITGAVSTGNDVTHSISVSAGDTLTIRSLPTGTPTSQSSIAFGLVFTPTTPGESFFGYGSGAVPANNANNFDQVLAGGNSTWGGSGAESSRILVPGPVTLKKVYVKIGTAPGVGTSRTITVRKTSASTALAVTMADASTSGNTAADVTYVQGDTIAYLSSVSGVPAALTGGVHVGVLMYATPTITIPTFVPVVMVY